MRNHWQHKAIWHKNDNKPLITAVQGGVVLTTEQGIFLDKVYKNHMSKMSATKKLVKDILESGYYTEDDRNLLNLLRELYLDDIRK